MQTAERRFRQRQKSVRLKLEFCRLGWFGRPKKTQAASLHDFAIGGLTMVSEVKLKPGQRLLLNLSSQHHRLQAVPAEVLRCEASGDHFRYALKFSLGGMPEGASRLAYTVLQYLEQGLQRNAA